jgi:hypothetical protein
VAATLIIVAALFSTVGAAQLSDAGKLGDALPCHEIASALAVDDCAHFNTIARKYTSGLENALNSLVDVYGVQGELQASAAYVTAVQLKSADPLTPPQAEQYEQMQNAMEQLSKFSATLSNLLQKISATQDQMTAKFEVGRSCATLLTSRSRYGERVRARGRLSVTNGQHVQLGKTDERCDAFMKAHHIFRDELQ